MAPDPDGVLYLFTRLPAAAKVVQHDGHVLTHIGFEFRIVLFGQGSFEDLQRSLRSIDLGGHTSHIEERIPEIGPHLVLPSQIVGTTVPLQGFRVAFLVIQDIAPVQFDAG